MRRVVLALIGPLTLLGCGDAGQTSKTDSPPANKGGELQSTNRTEESLVTDFKSPELAGLAVRDHPRGVQVVTPPSARGTTPPPIGTNDLLWTFAPKTIFTSVNNTPARDAKHFRELMDAVKPGEDVELGSLLFLEDAGDGQVMLRTTPPERQ